MSFHVAMLPAALEDLKAIWHYIGITNENPDAADTVVRSICGAIALLPRFPERGTCCLELVEQCADVRRLNVASHTIYYRVGDGVIEVGRIVHDRRHREETLRRWLLGGERPA